MKVRLYNSHWGLQLSPQPRVGEAGRALAIFSPTPLPRSSSTALFSPVAQLPWGQPTGCLSHCQSPPESPVHPWALALGTGKGSSAHIPGPGGSHTGTGRAGLPVWAGSWLWVEQWTPDPNMIPDPQVLSRSPFPFPHHPLYLTQTLAPCSIYCFLNFLLPTG